MAVRLKPVFRQPGKRAIFSRLPPFQGTGKPLEPIALQALAMRYYAAQSLALVRDVEHPYQYTIFREVGLAAYALVQRSWPGVAKRSIIHGAHPGHKSVVA